MISRLARMPVRLVKRLDIIVGWCSRTRSASTFSVGVDTFRRAAIDQRPQVGMHREGVTEQWSLHGQQAGLETRAGGRSNFHGERRRRAAFEADIGDEQNVQPHDLGISGAVRTAAAGAAARKLSMFVP